MKKSINYLLLVLVTFLASIFSISALTNSDIKVENNKATFSKIYEKEDDAKNAISDFEKYVKENNGKLVSTNVEKIVSEINTEILKDSFVVDDLTKIEEVVSSMQQKYDEEATENSSCEVILGEVETIEEEVLTYEEESGTVGEYDNYLTALIVSRMVENYENSKEDYSFRTNIVRELRVVNTLRVQLSGSFDNPYQRGLFLLPYYVLGYDMSNVDIYEGIVTDYTSEQKEFDTKDQRDAYIEELEEQGYTVTHDINTIREVEVENSRIRVDEDFASVAEANEYMNELKSNYNNVNVDITDNSYDVTTTSEVSQDKFTSEQEAQEYLDNLDNSYDLVYDKNVSSYTEQTTTSESIVKYFTSENDAYSYLRSLYTDLQSGETLKNDSVRKLSANEIDVNDIIEKGDIDLSSNGYSFALENDSTVRLRVNGRTETGIIDLTSVKINGENYVVGSHVLINDNAVASISGTVTYCAQRGNWNRCVRNETKEFTSEGIINVGNDLNVRFHFTTGFIYEYDYEVDNVTFENNDIVISDNLIPVYKLEVTKEKVSEETFFKASAKTFSKTRVGSFNVSGDAYNTKSVFVVDFTLAKDRTVYNVLGEATYDIYGTFYVIKYNAIKTIRSINTTYKQNYSVVETKKNISYKALAEATIEDIKAPNTGVADVTINYLALILSFISFVIYEALKITLKDQK